MTEHKIGTREDWLAARLELLKAETRRSDELTQWRQKLPWVRIDKEYHFETDMGTASLADLFRGRSQLHLNFTSLPLASRNDFLIDSIPRANDAYNPCSYQLYVLH